MFEAIVAMDFSAAHNLRGYQGKCEALHGHNWRVEVAVAAKRLDEIGMVADFGVIKKHLETVLGELDHRYLNRVGPFSRTNPTSENIAKWVFEKMGRRIRSTRCQIGWVRVWETATSCAVYRRP